MKRKVFKTKGSKICDLCNASKAVTRITPKYGVSYYACELCLAMGGISLPNLISLIKEDLAK